ncbi:hypothetical protein BJ742DRAFT_270091 [Cladochytrium replicatum]|nr:hypothetical protein BJ742DRAFT_270091 [Cladochytrium replicatum]
MSKRRAVSQQVGDDDISESECGSEEEDAALESSYPLKPIENLKTTPRGEAEDSGNENENSEAEDSESGKEDDTNEDGAPRLSYQQQVEVVLRAVLADEGHLFTHEELHWFDCYSGLGSDAQEVFIKLLNRRPKVERISRIRFKRMDQDRVDAAVSILVHAGFASDKLPEDDLSSWLKLLRKDELALFAGELRIGGIAKTKVAELSSDSFPPRVADDTHSPVSCVDSVLQRIKSFAGPTIHLSPPHRALFNRLFLVYNRSQTWPGDTGFMLDSILTNLRDSTRRRNFASFTVHRFGLTWPTREELLDYERCLRLEYEWAEAEAELLSVGKRDADAEKGRVRTRLREKMSGIMEVAVEEWERWVREERTHVSGVAWLQMFTGGWVVTRIVSQATRFCHQIEDFTKEIDLLRKLLAQRLYCQYIRGYWFDQLALTLHRYVDKEQAWEVCLSALTDPYLQCGHQRAIEKRVIKLKKNLGKRINLIYHHLQYPKAATYKLIAKRVFSQTNHKALWTSMDPSFVVRRSKSSTLTTLFTDRIRGDFVSEALLSGDKLVRDAAKESGGIYVEELALEWYKARGWKGYHSENSIITTLFGLLFWDVLFFCEVPGAFSSPYQTCPLDLNTEFFIINRADHVETRLAQIESGGFVEIIRKVDEREREKRTLCRGVSWKNFTREDIIEISQCFGGPALAHICRLFAQSYWAHQGGVPDLCIWKPKERKVMLVEVKGEGDQFSEKQRVWMDYLSIFKVEVVQFFVRTK